MPRQIDPTLMDALATSDITVFFMALLSFKSSMQRVWSGPGNLVWDSQTFTGVGSWGKVGTIQEGTNVQAYGTTITLSGIDPVLLGASLTDIQPGAQATIWFGTMTNGVIIGTPYQIFSGCMDQPTVTESGDTVSITIALESKMVDLARASNRKYTSADQRLYYPTDNAFGWVEQLNDMADIWGN